MDVEKTLTEKLSQDIADSIDAEMFDTFLDKAESESKVIPDNRIAVDPEYLHKIKMKVERILSTLLDYYELREYESEKYRYRLDREKLSQSKYHKLFNENKNIDGKQLRRGHEYIPIDFEDWLNEYLSDYFDTEFVYNEMCGARRIVQDDLKQLNKIAKKHKVSNE